MPPSVSVDLNVWLDSLQGELASIMLDMFHICKAVKEGRYTSEPIAQLDKIDIAFTHAERLSRNADQRAARNAVIAGMSRFIRSIDELIAYEHIMKDGISITKPLNGDEETNAYVQTYVEDKILAVGRDQSLSVPKKIDYFPAVDQHYRDVAKAYNKLRNALEHHHGKPKEDIMVTTIRLAHLANGREVKPGDILQTGEGLAQSTVEETKTFTQNELIVLNEQDAYRILFTLQHYIAQGYKVERLSTRPSRLNA